MRDSLRAEVAPELHRKVDRAFNPVEIDDPEIMIGAQVRETIKALAKDSPASNIDLKNVQRINVLRRVWEQISEAVSSEIIRKAFQVRDDGGASVSFEAGEKIREQIISDLKDSPTESVKEEVTESVSSLLYRILYLYVTEQVSDGVIDLAWESLSLKVGNDLLSEMVNKTEDLMVEKLKDRQMQYFSTDLWGSHEAYWISFYRYFMDLNIVQFDEKLKREFNLFSDLAESCNWWYPMKGFCVVCDRPEIVEMEDGQLHSENGPAIRYRDGFSVYSINGFRVNEKIVMTPELLTIDEIKAEDNTETRRIMIERYGMGKYLIEIDAKVIDYDHTGTFRALLVDGEGQKYLQGTDGSTKRVYFMHVPSHVNNCQEAHQAICGIDESMIVQQS